MGLIKSVNTPPQMRPFSMADVEAHAKTMLLRARKQADQLLAEAQNVADEIKKQASIDGHAEGHAQGKKEGIASGKSAALDENKKKLTDQINLLLHITKELEASRSRLISTADSEVIKLAIAIARKVTKLHGQQNDEVLSNNVREALRLTVEKANIKVAVHPNQSSLLSELLPQLKLNWPKLQHVEIVDDPRIAPGGCRVYTSAGQVDADLDTQLNRIAMELIPHTPAGE